MHRVEFAAWEPIYEAILDDFGYDRGADERARDVLADIVGGSDTCNPAALDASGQTVAIAGAADSLESDLGLVTEADAVFAASTAMNRLAAAEIAVDCVVTDLDKHADAVVSATESGLPAVVHAHGDNIPVIRDAVPAMQHARVVPTTQAAPAGPVRNFGGFTDGDRAAFLAVALGADRLLFPGWEFDDIAVSDAKRRKLVWAEHLLAWLEDCSGHCFPVLDGRRDALPRESVFPG